MVGQWRWAMLFSRFKLTTLLLLFASSSFAQTQSFTEDFSSAENWDSGSSTGLWNAEDGFAQAAAFANGDSTRPIDFGDGSLGVLNSTNGYTFDTDAYPNGFNFESVSITAGTITVTGSNPLIIRSLGPITLTPAIDVRGGAGDDGVQSGSGGTGPAGGTPIANGGAAGKGGDSVSGAASLMDGAYGVDPDGNQNTFAPGTGQNVQDSAAGAANFADLRPGADFDVAGAFKGGSGGNGGGGHFAAGDTMHATGGAGGAGGGAVRLVAVGDINIQTILADGGIGGAAADTVNAGANTGCASAGGGGVGGAVWIQTLGTLTTGANPTFAGGAGGAASTNCGGGPAGVGGRGRADVAGGAIPVWAGTGFDTTLAPVSQTYTVVSRAYDLKVANASFSGLSAPAVGPGTSSATVEFAGSRDGVTFGSYTSDITALSDQNYRYIRFRVTLVTDSVSGPSPTVSQITFNYEELGLNIDAVDLGLAMGCGSLQKVGGKFFKGPQASGPAKFTHGAGAVFFWLLVFTLIWRTIRITDWSVLH